MLLSGVSTVLVLTHLLPNATRNMPQLRKLWTISVWQWTFSKRYQHTRYVKDIMCITVLAKYLQWLAAAGIKPATDRTYSREDIEAALNAPRGVSAVVGCEGSELREVWYFF